MLIKLPDAGEITSIDIYDAEDAPTRSLSGAETEVLSNLKALLDEEDPDVVVLNDTNLIRWVTQKATQHGLSLGFGREGEPTHGRIILGYHSWTDMGLAGLQERSLFTLAPMGVSSDWEAGKTIDSRQCYEAYRQRVLVPEMKGGYVSSMNAWEMVKRDRGGMLFTPQVGLHENVGCIDFESMFPSIISQTERELRDRHRGGRRPDQTRLHGPLHNPHTGETIQIQTHEEAAPAGFEGVDLV